MTLCMANRPLYGVPLGDTVQADGALLMFCQPFTPLQHSEHAESQAQAMWRCQWTAWQVCKSEGYPIAGYVALSEDKRNIAVVFRGTRIWEEWLSNFTVLVTSWDEVDKTAPAADGKKIEDAVWVETVQLSPSSAIQSKTLLERAAYCDAIRHAMARTRVHTMHHTVRSGAGPCEGPIMGLYITSDESYMPADMKLCGLPAGV